MGGREEHDPLTPREREVLAFLREELSNDEIAARLGISVAGVKYHVSEILGKLDLENRADAARWQPEARRWLALAPLGVLRPRWLSPAITVGLALAVAATVGALAWALASSSGGHEAPGIVSAYLLEELQPGTTLHTVQVHYSRHGPADEVLQLSESYQPETLHTEAWMEYGSDGMMTSMRSETRDADGALLASAYLEDGFFVYAEDGVEQRRIEAGNLSLAALRQTIEDAIQKSRAELDAYPDAPRETVRRIDTVVIEERRPYTAPLNDVTPGNYVSVYVYDLQPVEKVTRTYVLPDGSWSVRDEVVAVGEDGTETVIESWDYLVAEVIGP